MIFDCHTHLGTPEHFGGDFIGDAKRAWGPDYRMACAPAEHAEALKQCDGAIVLAFDAVEAGFYVPNEFVADYVQRDPTRLLGFCSVNPNRANAVEILKAAKSELGLKGLKLGPIYQFFDPTDRICYPLYAKAEELRMPIMWHQGTSYIRVGPLELSNPVLLDPVARSFPALKMVIAHLGHPWFSETACVVRKHPNVFTDMSALGTRPWQFYNAMVCALEYGIQDKILFGTDFPFFDCNRTIQSLRNINAVADGTNMPRIPEAVIDEIIHRNTPEILGLI